MAKASPFAAAGKRGDVEGLDGEAGKDARAVFAAVVFDGLAVAVVGIASVAGLGEFLHGVLAVAPVGVAVDFLEADDVKAGLYAVVDDGRPVLVDPDAALDVVGAHADRGGVLAGRQQG